AAEAVGAHERLSVMPPDDIFDISLAEGTQLDADITALNALNSAANPTTVLALLDELEAAEKKTVEMPTFDGYVPHVARELQAAFRIACDNAGINVTAAGKGE
ncbi:ead/Ea22-like family protein, partial [Escherichia coli]